MGAEGGRVALAGRKPRRISAAAGWHQYSPKVVVVVTSWRLRLCEAFFLLFFPFLFRTGEGMGGRWTPVEKLLSSAFKKGQGEEGRGPVIAAVALARKYIRTRVGEIFLLLRNIGDNSDARANNSLHAFKRVI